MDALGGETRECVDHLMVVEDIVHKPKFGSEEVEKLEKAMKTLLNCKYWRLDRQYDSVSSVIVKYIISKLKFFMVGPWRRK